MFTERGDSESEPLNDKVASDAEGTPKPPSVSEVEGNGKLSDAIERHAEVIEETRWMVLQWLVLLSVNFFTHFMRMSVAMLYCIKRWGVSELSVGLMVTIHMLIMCVANSYICYAIDKYSFESLMIVRLGLLSIATLGEYLAPSFLSFAIIYCAASLAIVWFGVQPAYFVQMLPPEQAKSVTYAGFILNQCGILVGLSIGGFVGGQISISGVFLISFVVSTISLLWTIFVVRGTEKNIREIQANEIAVMYREFPEYFNDNNLKFPIPFVDEVVYYYYDNNNNDANEEELEGFEQSALTAVREESPNVKNEHEQTDEHGEEDADNGNDEQVMADVENPNDESQPMLPNKVRESEEDNSTLSLFSKKALPFWTITLRNGIATATMSEMVAWWNVYAHQVFGASLTASSSQCVIAIIVGLVVAIITLRTVKPQSLSFNALLDLGAPICICVGLLSALLFVLVFPYLSFAEFWAGMAVFQALYGLSLGFAPSTMQIAESPPKVAGKLFAVLTAMRSVIPAMQHVIVGLLWTYRGHGWLFRWFAILHVLAAMTMAVYFTLRRFVDPKEEADLLVQKTV